MKIAIISDIHGNMQALEKVLADIKDEGCKKIFCLGDLAMAGPEPVKTVDFIKRMVNDGKITVIQGNTDEMIGDFNNEIENKVKNAFPVMGNALENDVANMPNELKEFLKKLPKSFEITLEKTTLLFVHGSPRKNDENITPDLELEDVEEMLKDTTADLIFCGHTHVPCGYQTNTKQTVVNVGSVGRPFTPRPQACYVVADFFDGNFNIMHKFVDYDKEKAAKILSKREFDGADKLAGILVNPEFRHM